MAEEAIDIINKEILKTSIQDMRKEVIDVINQLKDVEMQRDEIEGYVKGMRRKITKDPALLGFIDAVIIKELYK
jgi:hypothetical protein